MDLQLRGGSNSHHPQRSESSYDTRPQTLTDLLHFSFAVGGTAHDHAALSSVPLDLFDRDVRDAAEFHDQIE
ncbi:MAG: hypothetical protein JWP06_249 [Candidatus Saccharibacteria bacterium]|nr:hypothetical protein [Candidatus Saccharibacteria bacterium]